MGQLPGPEQQVWQPARRLHHRCGIAACALGEPWDHHGYTGGTSFAFHSRKLSILH